MSVSTAALDFDLGALATRLAANLDGGTIDLSDSVLGLPLLDRLLHNPVLDVRQARLDLATPGTVDLHGTADLLGAAGVDLDLRFTRDGGAITGALTLTAAPGSPVTLSGLLGSVAGAGAALPPEVPDLGFTALTVSVTPQTGAFLVDGRCTVPWTLPFGAVGQVTVRLERGGDDAAPVQATVRLASAGPLAVTDGLRVTGFDLAFTHGGTGEWSLAGALDADLLDHPVTLSAGVTTTAGRREFGFHTAAATPVAVDLAGAGTLTATGLSIVVARALRDGAPADGARLDPDAAYAWTVEAAGALDLLDRAITLDGTLTVQGEPGRLALALRPAATGDAAALVVPLPGAPAIRTHLGLDRLDVSRTVVGGIATWSVAATTAVWFSGLPGGLGTVLPGGPDTELTGEFAVTTGAGVSLTVDPVLPMRPFHLPAVTVADFSLDLSQVRSAVRVGRLELGWTRDAGLSVAADFAVGIPAELNQVFGTGHEVFTVYDGTPGSLLALRLSASDRGGTPDLQLHALSSPFRKLVFTGTGDDRQATIDLGDYGSFSFLVPAVDVQGGTFRARGGFTQHGLALPLAPLKRLTTALGLDAVNRFLPDRLPLSDLRLYDAVHGLDVDALFDVVMTPLRTVSGLDLPADAEIRAALSGLAAQADRLPDRLKPYLDIRIPESLTFDLAVSAEGGMLGGLSVAAPGGATPSRSTAVPLRMLIPGLSVTGPVLTGIELWSLQVGEILGGAALLVRADLNVDQFDLLPLAAALALPAAGLPDPRQFTRRVVAQRLTVLVIPEALVAVPVFCDDLGVEYRGIEGADFGAHLSFPEPELDLSEALAQYERLKSFFTDPDATLDEQAAGGHGLDLRLTAGPCYLQLPDYLGGQTLGSRTATVEASAAAGVAHLLNGLKKLRLDELLRALPAAVLHAPPAAQPHLNVGPLTFEAGWDIGTPAGQSRGLAAHLTGTAALGPFAHLVTTLDVRTAAGGGVGVSFTADGDAAGVFGLHLDGSLGNGSPAGGGSPAALAFTDPAARVVASGPSWTPQTFTVEWWMYPTALRDWNQFVSGADVWGSFVFHCTSDGAVYCGTDVATRFTPAEVPAGTVRLNTWQHFAFTYSYGTASLFRNGVRIAHRTGLAGPAPWTGMRLGISEGGTQPDGLVADLRVWNTSRTDLEIQAAMAHRLTGTESGLVGYWPLDDGAGGVVRDLGPSGFTGTATGTTWRPLPPPVGAAPAEETPAVRFTGGSRLRAFGRDVFTGTVALGPDRATLAGHLDLFPAGSPLAVRGNLTGRLDARDFALNGNAEVDLGGLTLAAGTAAVTGDTLTVTGDWLGLFRTSLALDTTVRHTRLTGTVQGTRSIDVPCAGVTLHPVGVGAVKLADRFHFRADFDFSVTVTADEVDGISGTGQVTFSLNGSSFTLPLSFGTPPAGPADLDRLIITAAQSISMTLFRTLYQDAEQWLQGVATQAVGWTRTAWQDTGNALQFAYGKSSTEIARILDQASYGAGEIGQVLRATFTAYAADPTATVLGILRQTGFPVVKVGDALVGGFNDLADKTNRDATVQWLTRIMRKQYPATEMIKVGYAYRITSLSAVSILNNVGYQPTELSDAAAVADAYHLDYRRTADTFDAMHKSASTTITALKHTFNVGERAIAAYLYQMGYAGLAELNAVLIALHITPLPA